MQALDMTLAAFGFDAGSLRVEARVRISFDQHLTASSLLALCTGICRRSVFTGEVATLERVRKGPIRYFHFDFRLQLTGSHTGLLCALESSLHEPGVRKDSSL
jgi:hypothetical protein